MSVITLVSIFASQALTPRVTEAEEILKQIAGTGMLYVASWKSEESLKSAEVLSEAAAKEFKKFPPEIQELAELAYVQRSEDVQVESQEKSKNGEQVSIPAENGLDRLETISVLAGHPKMVYGYFPDSPDFTHLLPKLSNDGHLVLETFHPKRKPGVRYISIRGGPPYFLDGTAYWSPAEFRRARSLILQGAFVLPA